MRAQKLRRTVTALLGFTAFSALAGVLVAASLTPLVAVAGVTATNTVGIFDSLPEFIELGDQPQKNAIFAVEGVDAAGAPVYRQIAQVYDQNREEVGWDAVSQFLKDATVAGEDRRFYEHGGVDLPGVIRAAVENASGTSQSGASTLSMQLVKNIYIQDALQLPTDEARKAGIAAAQEATLDRKLKEMKLAIGLEKKYTKDEILLGYLNIAGFGGNNYGVQAAAQRYYGVSAADVTLAQAASLVAIVQEPGARGLDDPANYAANLERRDVILRNMFVEGTIDRAQLDEALAVPVDETTVVLAPYTNGCIAADPYATYFCDYVTALVPELESLGGTASERAANWKLGGYKLYTTLDLRLQTVAQDTVTAQAPATETRLALGAAAVSVQPGTGRILTMAQNTRFDNTELGGGPGTTSVNYTTDRPYGGSRGFQAGSTYKVFTLINWLQNGHGLNEVVDGNGRTVQQAAFANSCPNSSTGGGVEDGPFGGPWPFKNSSGERGSRSVMDATAASINGAYVSMGLQLDQCETKRIAQALGVHTANNVDDPATTDIVENQLGSNPSAIIGTNTVAPLTMAAAYAGIVNHGTYCAPVAVDSLTDADGVALPGQAHACSPAITSEAAATTAYALENAMARYAGNPRDGVPILGKTGTTDDFDQTWLMSSTTAVTTAVWFGNVSGKYDLTRYPGGINNRHTIAKPINAAANALYPGGAFDAPSAGLVSAPGIALPSLVGGSVENARSIVEGLGLVYSDGGQADSTAPAGTVVSPGDGTTVTRGSTVAVVTSNGALVDMPDLLGSEAGAASSTLTAAGFAEVKLVCVALGETEPGVGTVVSSNPAAGAAARTSDGATLGVGKAAC
ncbi:membrane peptidoglycan carboxypeptidase [Conyzicola lurida]|uniref:Membrane peptidoglycan carboxypeptidase n=1 Tax=Conyzicola lurida TaxID=1172621 RepID=A0A841AKN6_9MICO|nr:transglycosylase domain-containing protein [Conyzicola lurida]MBB5842035.1 membrane peptidoglycan carboxypeptidase [Conyzicola lurida]